MTTNISWPEPPPPPKKPKLGLWARIGLIFGGIVVLGASIGLTSGSDPAPAAQSAAPSTTAAPRATYTAPTYQAPALSPAPVAVGPQSGTIPNGSWLVPTEVTPGEYSSTGPDAGLIEYCQITTYDANGDLLEWKNAGQAGTRILVTVGEDAATVTNSGCGTFTKVQR